MNEQITVNLNNLTEEEREQFKTLVDKGRGKSSREGREEIFAKYEQKMTDLFNEYIKEIKQVPDFREVVDVKEIVIE